MQNQTNGTTPENGGRGSEKGKKRASEEEELSSAPQPKAARRSLGNTTARVEAVEEAEVVQEAKKKGRRSAVMPTQAATAVGR